MNKSSTEAKKDEEKPAQTTLTTPILMALFPKSLAFVYGYGSEVVGKEESPEFQELRISPVIAEDVFKETTVLSICFDKKVVTGKLFAEIYENSMGFYIQEHGEVIPLAEIVWLGDFNTSIALYEGAMIIINKFDDGQSDDEQNYFALMPIKTDDNFFAGIEVFGVSQRIDFKQLALDVEAQMLPNTKSSLH